MIKHTADIISVHLPLNKKTFHFLNRNNLINLKPAAIIVNTSRGEVIEEKFLISLTFLKEDFNDADLVIESFVELSYQVLQTLLHDR